MTTGGDAGCAYHVEMANAFAPTAASYKVGDATIALDPDATARLARRIVAASGAPELTTVAPFTGQPLVTLPTSTPDDVERAVASARQAQQAWRKTPARARAGVFTRLHKLLLRRQDEALDLIQLETGKARLHAFEEIADVALVANYYAKVGPGLLKPRRRTGLIPGLTSVRELRHPVGVVGIIAPWNYPLTLALSDAIPALLAGNTVVLKPDNQTVLTALWAAEMLARAGLPDGAFQVVVGDGAQIGGALIDHVDYVWFTGSTTTGKIVGQQAASRLIGASLELGGKNPTYVTEDVDVETAAEGVVRACFSNAGQLCISTERLLVHEKVADDFLDAFIRRVNALTLGASLDFDADVGSLTSAAQLERVSAHVDDAVARGAVVLTGGRARPDLGPYFYEPTVLIQVPGDATCANDETFGPVVGVQIVADDAQALRIANDTTYGLTASIWVRDTRRGRRWAQQVAAGSVTINDAYAAAWGSSAAPAGGVKASGLGRRHGLPGLLAATEAQTIAVQRLAHRGLGLGQLFQRDGATIAPIFTAALRALRYLPIRQPRR